MHLEGVFHNDGAWPETVHQLIFGDDFAGRPGENFDDLEIRARQPARVAAVRTASRKASGSGPDRTANGVVHQRLRDLHTCNNMPGLMPAGRVRCWRRRCSRRCGRQNNTVVAPMRVARSSGAVRHPGSSSRNAFAARRSGVSEALGEAIVDRRPVAFLIAATMVRSQACEAEGGAQFPEQRFLLPGDVDRLNKRVFRQSPPRAGAEFRP